MPIETTKKMKEWIKEYGEILGNYLLIFAFSFALAVLVCGSITLRQINKRNTETATLRDELSAARDEVLRAGTTIEVLRAVQYELTDGLERNNGDLHSVIEELQFIRDEVRVMETVLDSYYTYNGVINNDNNNTTTEVENENIP